MLRLFPLLLATVAWPILAEDNADAVNERIPVSRLQLEEHWQVDCGASWQALAAAVAAAGSNCQLPDELRRSLQLCSFIYQPPGSTTDHCPDYRAAVASGAEHCEQLAELTRPCQD